MVQERQAEFKDVPPRHGGGAGVATNTLAQDSADWDGQEVPLPRDIVQWLDQFVVGQGKAKRVRPPSLKAFSTLLGG